MLVFFLLFFFCHLFPAFNLGAFLFCFFVPSSMPCFHVTTLSPLHPMLQRLRLGFSVAGWALGRFRSIRFGSGRYPEQFTDTTTGVCEGFLCPVSRIFFFFFPLYNSIPSVTRCQKCTLQGACFWKWSRPLWDSAVFVPTYLLLSCPWDQLLRGHYSFQG